MRQRLMIALGFFLACSAGLYAQRPPVRQYPVLSDRQQIKPYPTATYSAEVHGDISGSHNNGFFDLGRWSIAFVEPGQCSECDPGQYFIAADFSGMSYNDGTKETGRAFGYLNPSRGVIEFHVLTASCQNTPTRLPELWGGDFGPVAGPHVKIGDDDRLTGHVSGYTCFGERISADITLIKERQ